jgi:hypothetical protein
VQHQNPYHSFENRRDMKCRRAFLTLALCLLGVAVCLAQAAQMGAWVLNEAKSKLSRGSPKNTRVVFEPAGDDVKVTLDGVGIDSKPTHSEWTGKFDGKDYPVSGDPNSDVRSYTKIDDRTLGLNVRKGGNDTLSGRIQISADGKTRTVTVSGVDSNGKKFHSVAVYDKQQ